MSADPRWTDEVEDRFALIVVNALATVADEDLVTEEEWADPDDQEARDEIVAALRPALAALAEAGLLLTPGGDIREEFAVSYFADGNERLQPYPGQDAATVQSEARTYATWPHVDWAKAVKRTVTGWVDVS